MKLSIGIVGLPNAGKSTLFNALLGRRIAESANYPFCTIDPNIGVVEVPDEKLDILAEIEKSEKKIPAVVEFVDIAGLVKGAAQGEGLGNKFLSNIRDCQAILHLVRGFGDDNVVRQGSSDPQSDFEVICTELILKDLESIEKYLDDNKKKIEEKKKFEMATKIRGELLKGNLAIRSIPEDEEERKIFDGFFLLTAKPFFIVVNTDEDTYKNIINSKLQIGEWETVPVCAKIEEELSEFSPEEKREYLDGIGIEKSGLDLIIKKAYKTLGLQPFYTAGKKEARVWTIKAGDRAPQAAGAIHTDFERGFIMAEISSYSDFVKNGGWDGVKQSGKIRHEGKNYIMKEDDVVVFRFNV